MGDLIQFPSEPPMPFSQRPDGPECECTEDRSLLPCDWGWRCMDCGLPVPRVNTT